jgi:methylmalonyl-CoA mutase C-terminal domain/subunit
MTIFSKILRLLKKKKLSDVLLIGGGILPQDDIQKLEKMGVDKLWGPDTPTQEIVEYLKGRLLTK